MRDEGLGTVLADHARRHSVPGAAIAILRSGRISEAHWGTASLRTNEPVSDETRFPIGSVTKPVTAAALAQLAEAGTFSLDQPVSELLGELHAAPWAQKAAVRDLLANRARVPLRAAWEFSLEDGGPDALERCVALVKNAEPAADAWSYSNVGWSLAGCIIERLTGRPWEEATRTHVLEPAGMTQTTFALSPASEPRAEGHRIVEGQATSVKPWIPRVYCSSGSSLLSTAGDLLRFVQWHFDQPARQRLWETRTEVAIHGWLDGWGLGWAGFNWDGGRVVGWDGLVPGHRVVLRVMPDDRAAIALLMNGDTGRAMYRSLFGDHLKEWFGIEMPPLQLEPSPDAAGDLDKFAGTYAWSDRRCRVTAAPDRLLIEIDGRTREAFPIAETAFVIDPADPDNPTVTFGEFDEHGLPRAIYVMLWALPRTGIT